MAEQTENGGVFITLRDIYGDVRSMRAEFADMSAEFRGMRSDLRDALDTKEDHETRLREVEQKVSNIEATQTHQADYGTRLRSVEGKVIWWSGIAVVIGAGGSAALSAAAKAFIGG